MHVYFTFNYFPKKSTCTANLFCNQIVSILIFFNANLIKILILSELWIALTMKMQLTVKYTFHGIWISDSCYNTIKHAPKLHFEQKISKYINPQTQKVNSYVIVLVYSYIEYISQLSIIHPVYKILEYIK